MTMRLYSLANAVPQSHLYALMRVEGLMKNVDWSV
jgi:hypothetical protein